MSNRLYYTPLDAQKYSSANTSVNSKRLPALFNKLDFQKLSGNGDCPLLIVDFGCGKYSDTTRSLLREKYQDTIYMSYLPADPTFQPDNYENLEDIVEDWRKTFDRGVVVCVCSNVLNVIKEDPVIWSIKNRLFAITPFSFFSVYEGNKTGIGSHTKLDCWQRNRRIEDYIDRFYFEGVKHGVLHRMGKDFIK